MNTDTVRLAILGCGAVTELGHLPAIAGVRNAQVTLLVDTNAERRQRLATTFNVERTTGDVEGSYNLFDAAIVALPHALHAPASIKLLQAGKSVLVEKPMALTVAECDAMISAASAAGAVIAVGLVRRFIRSWQLARALIADGFLGRIESFDCREGNIYNWPVASDFFFRKESAGGGVLFDTGAHTLDSLIFLLGDFAELEYFDDAEGGVDANCLINLRLRNGASGVVELSRTRRLRNSAIVRGERGVLELPFGSSKLKLSLQNQPYVLDGSVGSSVAEADQPQDYLELADDSWKDGAIDDRLSLMEQRPEIVLSFADHESYSVDGRLLGTHFAYWPRFSRWLAGRKGVLPLGKEAFNLMFAENVCGTGTVIARRAAIEAAGRFDRRLRICEDFDLWLKLSRSGEVFCSTTITSHSLNRPGSTSKNLPLGLACLELVTAEHLPYADWRTRAIVKARLATSRAEVAEQAGHMPAAVWHRLSSALLDPTRRSARELLGAGYYMLARQSPSHVQP